MQSVAYSVSEKRSADLVAPQGRLSGRGEAKRRPKSVRWSHSKRSLLCDNGHPVSVNYYAQLSFLAHSRQRSNTCSQTNYQNSDMLFPYKPIHITMHAQSRRLNATRSVAYCTTRLLISQNQNDIRTSAKAIRA